MANMKQMDIIKKGVDTWNAWRINNCNILPSLSDAGLHMAYLKKANLSKADLSDAGLSGADLSNAILRDANLIGTNLTGANLEGADLTNAVIGATLFGNVDLSNVKGLESLQHLGPSTIGIDTIYKSKGKVPIVFLKNAGVPRHLIDYIELFVDQNKKHYSCFITYSKKNEEFAHKLYEDLQAHGVSCWLSTSSEEKIENVM